jgi:uncharacterized membrane protein SpoIIM required for sporulation
MIESIINPKRIERGPIKMFFVGLIFATFSLLITHWFFSSDFVLSQYAGMIVVTFCVMFSFPYIYFMIKQEEREDEEVEGFFEVWNMHKDAIYAFMWLFLGFIVALSICNVILKDPNLFNAQLQTYCMINAPGNMDSCIARSSPDSFSLQTGAATKEMRLISIIENNVYVMIFTLLFSLIFGAGAIFVLAWNASVIASAVGIFTKYELTQLPIGICRYMIHGIPEIAAYFVTALAGGILGTAIIRKQLKKGRFLRILENCVMLLFMGIVLLILAALIETYITPILFN